MECILSSYPALQTLCKYLTFKELERLSSVSKDWFLATNQFFINRSCFRISPLTPQNFDSIRKHKHGKLSRMDFEQIYTQIPDSLEELQLYCVRNWTFKQLQRFKKLRSLDMTGINLERSIGVGPDDDMITGLVSLKIAILEGDSLNLFQDLINRNHNLRVLRVDFFSQVENKTEMVNDFFKNLNLPNIQDLQVSGQIKDSIRSSNTIELCNIICDDGLEQFFENHRNLKSCDLRSLVIKDEVVRKLREFCHKLETLSLNHCHQLTGKALLEIQSMRNLKYLDLENISFKAADMEKFKCGPNLKTFKLQFFRNYEYFHGAQEGLGTNQMKGVLNSSQNLIHLDLSYFEGFSALNFKILPFIADHLPNLISLSLYGQKRICKGLNKKTSKKIHFKKLQKLGLFDTDLNDSLLHLIYAPELRVFSFSTFNHISGGLRQVVNNCPKLTELHMSECTGVDDEDIIYCMDNLLNLRELNIGIVGEEVIKKMILDTKIEKSFVSLRCDIEGDHFHSEFLNWAEGFRVDNSYIFNGVRHVFYTHRKPHELG